MKPIQERVINYITNENMIDSQNTKDINECYVIVLLDKENPENMLCEDNKQHFFIASYEATDSLENMIHQVVDDWKQNLAESPEEWKDKLDGDLFMDILKEYNADVVKIKDIDEYVLKKSSEFNYDIPYNELSSTLQTQGGQN